jgi:hypothetical protein
MTTAEGHDVRTTVHQPPERSEPRAGSSELEWLAQTEASLRELLKLPANWNSYGAVPVQEESVARAMDLLRRIARPDTPPPTGVPTVRGGVQLEWHRSGIDLELEIGPTGPCEAFYEDADGSAGWSFDPNGSDLSRLTNLTARLTQPH